jgi:hypothetical protein
MAGSYRHATTDDGKLLSNKDFIEMIENLGDAYEMAEEMYGMIWWLADQIAAPPATDRFVELARQNWQRGIEMSPGRDE